MDGNFSAVSCSAVGFCIDARSQRSKSTTVPINRVQSYEDWFDAFSINVGPELVPKF